MIVMGTWTPKVPGERRLVTQMLHGVKAEAMGVIVREATREDYMAFSASQGNLEEEQADPTSALNIAHYFYWVAVD